MLAYRLATVVNLAFYLELFIKLQDSSNSNGSHDEARPTRRAEGQFT